MVYTRMYESSITSAEPMMQGLAKAISSAISDPPSHTQCRAHSLLSVPTEASK